jgi:hypothetical protein
VKRLLLAVALLAAAVPALSRPADEFVEVRNKLSTIRSDRAYLLVRVRFPKGHFLEPVFLREPTTEELARYDAAKLAGYERASKKRASLAEFHFEYNEIANVDYIDSDRVFAREGEETYYLVEAKPGSYVIYGLWWAGLNQCFCLGTVSFQATAGMVTDLGTFLEDRADARSQVPELAGETGLGTAANGDYVLMAAGIRPATASTAKPLALAGISVTPADYRAVGTYTDRGAVLINRLAPMAGVLAYNGGKVIDVRTSREAENR